MPYYNGKLVRTARCRPCKIYYFWAGRRDTPKVKDARCLYCQRRLTLTTHLCKDTRVRLCD